MGERVARTGNNAPGFDAERKKLYEPVTEQNYPKIYNALKAECAFRGFEMPACYVDHTGETRLGRAFYEDYTVLIDKKSDEIFNEGEMRALMAHELKHLYQAASQTTQQSKMAEYDSDRAAIGSTDYVTVRSYVDKAIDMMIDEKVPTSILRGFVHGIHHPYPGLIAENFFLPLDRYHASPESRMSAMREAERNKHYGEGR